LPSSGSLCHHRRRFRYNFSSRSASRGSGFVLPALPYLSYFFSESGQQHFGVAESPQPRHSLLFQVESVSSVSSSFGKKL
jgi:hypothetical protein